MTGVYEQLRSFCNCLPDMDDSVFERNTQELIHLVSILTCWLQEPCETFLNATRTQFMDVGRLDPCACDGSIVQFEPFYYPLQPNTFKVELIETSGIEETVTELTADKFRYSDTFHVLKIDLSGYAGSDNCGCPEDMRLRISYDAGYEEIPDCLLQLFCDVLHVISDKNNCNCEACQACKSGDVEIEYADDVSPKLETYLNALVESAYKMQLGLISLCGNTPSGWGVVM